MEEKYFDKKSEEILNYLNNAVNREMRLSELIDAFENMCMLNSSEKDMILFETGTFSFTGESLFYFSLVRQFSNGEDEFFQLHVDIMYQSNSKNADFSNAYWNDEIEGNFFDFIKTSKVYMDIKDEEIFMLNVYMDET